MRKMTQYSKALSTVFVLALLATACTKPRKAALPPEMQKSVFAISEFGDIQTENSPFSLETDNSLSDLSLGNSSKATAEKGLVSLDSIDVPTRMKYMFSGLEITAATDRIYPVTFSVDKQFVTAYKVVTNPDELTILEKQLAQVKEEVVLQKQLQKNQDKAKAKTLLASLKKAREGKANLLSQKKATLLVPLFKYRVTKYGVLEKQKNSLNEETTTLDLAESDWEEATHITLSTTKEGRLPVGVDPSQAGDLDRTFVMDRINNKIMTAGTLASEFDIPLNLPQDARVLTLLDVKSMHIFEVTQLGKAELTDSQQRQLQSGTNPNVRRCPTDVVKVLPEEAQKNCILVLRYDVGLTYVRPELPVVDAEGNQDSRVDFKPVLAGQNIGLVQIPKGVEPSKVESNNELDPNTTMRIADIKDKEFFFKRTLEDASYSAATPGLAPGMAGNITIVKFEFEENRVVLRNADKLVGFKTTSNDSDYEEVMSLPVKYLKLESKDASGATYAMPRLVPANRQDAQYIEVDWTNNTIPQYLSPYSAIYEGCILGTASAQVADVDMRLSTGVLNFSQKYTLALRPECIADFDGANGYNGGSNYQYTARVTERVSLKLNDHSTDKSFVKEVPFKVQNTLNYGVWTTSRINPDANGQYGREGTEINNPMVHDFRNGKVLHYTVTGLPTDDPEMRQLLKGIVEELVAAWNAAYKQAFKGSSLDRSGPYITYEIAGENGVTAHLGDLDKNIFHFENKYASHGILGVSQVGFNPRSAIVVADSLILYSGNVKSDVSRNFEEMKLRAKWEAQKAAFHKEARSRLSKQEQAAGEATSPNTPVSDKLARAQALISGMAKKIKNPKMRAEFSANLKNIGQSAENIRRAVQQQKSLGGAGSFAYSSPRTETAWMDRALRSFAEKPDMSVSEIRGTLAKEFLASKGNSLSQTDKDSLNSIVRQSAMQAKMMNSMKASPGCLQTAAESANANYTNLTFNEAFRIEALNTMAHEMGHSQGLTHNFIGSFDKANYANEDGTPSKRNYSSVMDYLTPGKFSWDGLGSYDIRALRASHLGLLEVSPEFKKALGDKAPAVLVQGKYISINTIQKAHAKDGWANFSAANIKGVLKPYKYCTDIHVGADPLCQRHDFGSSVTEIVESLINDWEDNYIANYHAWNRLSYSVGEAFIGPAWSQRYMTRMRKFMDETFYQNIFGEISRPELFDFVLASEKVYQFYLRVLTTPDTTASFQSPERFMAVPYDKEETDSQGKRTGKRVKDVAVVEKRALSDISVGGDSYRIDTMGLEFDKISAMRFITLRGFPSYRYDANSVRFSFLDFEKYVMGLPTEDSIFVNMMASLMMDKLNPMFTNDKGELEPIDSEYTTVSSAMRTYAAVYGVLNLEASTMEDKDNFANLFKVASSVGDGPSDRLVLNPLGVSANSKTRVGYWALDNALVSESLLQVAAKKNFFIQNTPDLKPLFAKLSIGQMQVNMTQYGVPAPKGVNLEEQLAAAKKSLIQKLHELNKKEEIVTAEAIKANPKMSIEGQVDFMMDFNANIIDLVLASIVKNQPLKGVTTMREATALLSDEMPLFAMNHTAMIQTLKEMSTVFSISPDSKKFAALGQQAVKLTGSGNTLETTYGGIMKNIEFLNLLTGMTNPEYLR